MPVVEAVQTFVGIVNENEFYSHHYLAEVFKGDIRERLEQWAAAEEADPAQRAPFKQLASWAGQWFALRNAGTRSGAAAEQLDSFQQVQQGLFQALGYAHHPPAPGTAGWHASAGVAGDRRCWQRAAGAGGAGL